MALVAALFLCRMRRWGCTTHSSHALPSPTARWVQEVEWRGGALREEWDGLRCEGWVECFVAATGVQFNTSA